MWRWWTKLLQHGARVDLITKGIMGLVIVARSTMMVFLLQYNDTALLLACQNNDLTTASVLLRAGAYPNGCNNRGQTPLLQAVRHKNLAMVRDLVQANADVNQMEQGGLSPLMMCCEQGDSEMAKLLLDSQANPNLQQSVEYHS
ncbi:Ankyrin-3, partial [Geodia barretti]